MLNYSVQPGELVEENHQPEEGLEPLGTNPFPGLRPFSIEESHLFFGREGQVDEILLKLSQHRSVTIMGYSGSGKSSLMYCGLVPVLYGGFMINTSPNWQIIATRPGTSPITNLTEAIVNYLESTGKISADDKVIQCAIIKSVLLSGPDGLVEVSNYLQRLEKDNIFFLIDQFEELLRYRELGEDNNNEAAQYVNLVLNAVTQKDVPIYVSLSMRSDFIGECSVFPGLTQMINNSNYLVPQMGREQKRLAIEGPVAVGGGKITSRLVKRLLGDISDHQDQLPIMQHALMRTWDYWVANREPGEPMDLRHYNAIGRISQALSLHANEAYEELTASEKEIAEVLFKSVTEKNEENQGLRRPAKIKFVSELAGASEEEVIRVVECFRRTGRSFLMPGSQINLSGATTVELSHESLMRIWNRLSNWVEEEFESAQLYKRISNAAALYQTGKAGLWRPPDLQLALNWQKKQKPTRVWAQRYDIAFERSIVFLDTSRITYEAELKNQEMLQRRMLRRARVTSLILGIAAIIAIIFMIYGFTQSIEAGRQSLEAGKQRDIAISNENKAVLAKVEAEQQRKLAIEGQQKLAAQAKVLEKALGDAKIAQAEAEKNYREALRQEQIAISAEGKERAASEEAKQQTVIARSERDRANRLLYLSIAQSMEAKSVTIDDKELAGLLAMQGYLYHSQYDGHKYDPYVFSGLYYSIAKLSENFNYNQVKVPGNLKNKMFALAVSKKESTFYTTGNDGRIFKGDYLKQTADNLVDFNPYPNRVLALSIDEKYLINGSDSSAIQIFHLEQPGEKPGVARGHKGFVNDIKFLPDNSGFISVGSDRTVRFTNHITGQGRLLATLPYDIKSIDINQDGTRMAGVAASGQLIMLNLSDNTFELKIDESKNQVRVLSVAFHPSRQILAYGTEFLDKDSKWKGSVKLINYTTLETLKELRGHNAGVSDVEFSPDGLLLASSGYDKKLQMWVVDHEQDLPVVMDNNNGNIWKLAFAKGSNYLLVSCNNGEIRVWPTDPKMLAEQICPKLKRNMTKEEWDIYVGNGIGYESTCKNLLISDF
jgi:WD40 repeat protein